MRRLLVVLCSLVVVVVAVLAGMIAFGTSNPPPPLASVGQTFEKVVFRDLPAVETVPARQGTPIAFRRYPADPRANAPERIVIAIHGSSATSASMHPLAKALRTMGMTVYAPDIRGHGETGRRGDIDYAGQLDDDLADVVAAVRARHPNAPLNLVGFSSGGGFALHVAGSLLGAAFERIVLISPMLGPRTPTVRTGGAGGWAKAFLPRIYALVLLDRLGIHQFDYLPTLAFAIPPQRADLLTGTYSFRLMSAFATRDYAADLRAARARLAVLVGERDELFIADRFAPTIAVVRPDVRVTVYPGLNHVEMILDPGAQLAVAVEILRVSCPNVGGCDERELR